MCRQEVPLKLLTAAMEYLFIIISSILYHRLKATQKTPVVLRLCKELQFAPCETRAFVFLLVCHGGVDFRTFTDVRPTASSMAKFAGMNSHEFVNFLGEERTHFKQGLLGSTDSRTKRVSTQSVLKIPEEVVSSLYLVKLTETAFLKLDKTSLADIVRDEGLIEAGFEDLELVEGDDGSSHEEEEADAEDDKKRKASGRSSPIKVRKVEEEETEKVIGTLTDNNFEPVLPVWNPDSTVGVLAPTSGLTISIDTGPYTHDLQYLDDVFKLLATTIRLRTTESDLKDDDPEMLVTPKSKQEAQLRELKGRERMLKLRIEKRMMKTKAAGGQLPRMEALQRKRGFSNFEKMVLLLLVGNIMSHDVLIAANGKYVMRGDTQRDCTVGYLLYVLCDSLEERVQRRSVFYKAAPLLKDGLLTVTSKSYGASDLMECTVDIDRRMVDSLMGLDTEFSEIVEGSHLYTAKVPLDNVVIPLEQKQSILNHITNYDAFQRCKRKIGFEEVVSYGTGLVILFYGPSGTGKTMLANAIAHKMEKKVLLVSLQQIRSSGKSPELLRFVFREAKLSNAVVFFDECDSLFESRESNPAIAALLQELEHYQGIMILATNKAHALDEAMNRRITLTMEFRAPDHQMRCEIWKKHIPPQLRVSDSVDWASLATDYELSGGLIKNALLTAISHAVSRENGNDNPMLKTEDLVLGAKTQLRSFFNKDLNQPHQLIPKRSIDDCIFDKSTRDKLIQVIQLYKGKRHIQSNWGFSDTLFGDMNCTILLYGPSGVGKSLAAEAIAYECGHVVRTLNIKTLRKGHGIDQVFEQVSQSGALLVIDEAQDLLNHSDESKEMLHILHYHAKKCARPVLIIARTEKEVTLDPVSAGLEAFLSIKISYPTQPLRLQHWKKAFPSDTPLDASLSFDAASEKSLSPGAIKSAAFFAACRASMLPPARRVVTQAILNEALGDIERLTHRRLPSMYS
eukprot:TRINITY_DN4270_c0_g1_i4.p1 TRINITY_DN4270_c0_g1~~TRINITY_DN4270_c0_g1_i4.p1  ORF type:complete len:964 (+),score=170.94 TRINITY_DN4270_c0_g1_i4:493-3384(+)